MTGWVVDRLLALVQWTAAAIAVMAFAAAAVLLVLWLTTIT